MKPSLRSVLVIGDIGVGKSSIINRFNNEEFNEIHQKSLKIEMDDKSIFYGVNENHFLLKVIGIPAQYRFFSHEIINLDSKRP
jgi:GTPase SAR1 family protein